MMQASQTNATTQSTRFVVTSVEGQSQVSVPLADQDLADNMINLSGSSHSGDTSQEEIDHDVIQDEITYAEEDLHIIIIPSGGSILIPSRRDLPIDILQEEIEHYAFQDEITSIEGESTSNQSQIQSFCLNQQGFETFVTFISPTSGRAYRQGMGREETDKQAKLTRHQQRLKGPQYMTKQACKCFIGLLLAVLLWRGRVPVRSQQ